MGGGMIMEDLVPFDLAKKLKEKGFPIKTKTEGKFGLTKLKEVEILPTISQVLKWLRVKYSIHISTKPYSCEDGLMWMYEIRKFNKYIIFVIANKTGFVEEEQASIASIEYVIDNLI